jgi:ketosteroid isomerase-like protein
MSARRVAVCATVAAVVLQGSQAQCADFTAQDAAAVRKSFDDAVRNVRAGDWTAWAAQWSEDAVLQPSNSPEVKGRKAILAWGLAFPTVETLTISNVQISGDGDIAYGTSAYAMTIKGSSPDRGKQLIVLRRSSAGQWEAVAGSVSSDLPVPGQTPATAPKR